MVAKKTTAKKAPAKAKAAKKAPAKEAPAKKAAVKKAPVRKITAVSSKFTKAQVIAELADQTDLSKVQVSSVLSELDVIIERHIKKRGVGEFSLPGLLKIKTVKKPARKARKGINPFTGEPTTFKARPASTGVRVTALKRLKDMSN